MPSDDGGRQLKNRSRHRFRLGAGVIAAVALVAWVSVPVASVWWLSAQTRRAEVAPAQTTWAPVEAHEGHLSRDASIYLDWVTEPPIAAPAWNGTVTASGIVAGAAISSGQSLLVVDGVQRLGFATPLPFYRPLGMGDSGDDVKALRDVLSARGLEPASSETLNSRDLRAIRGYAASIGVPNATQVGFFDPSWVVFLPSNAATIAKTNVSVGSPVPSAGAPLAELAPRVSSGRLVERVNASNSDGSNAVDPATLMPMEATSGERVIVGGKEVALSEKGDILSAGGIQVVQTVAKPGAPLVSANVVSSSQAGLWVVPAASLLTDLAGNSCVVTKQGTKSRQVAVKVAASEGGDAVVSGPLHPRDLVALNTRVGASTCR